MSNYEIRIALPQDLQGVYKIFSLADTQHRQAHPEFFRETPDPKDTKDFLLSSIRSKDAVVFVAEDCEQIIGGILAWVRQTPDRSVLVPRTYVSIENLVVANAFRHHGIGKALMEQIHLWSEEHGIQQIQLTVWDFNKCAQEFYKNLGYEMLNHRMRKELT